MNIRFVDSNIFVYNLAADPTYGKIAAEILDRIDDGEEAVTSTFVVSQVCGYLRWKRRADAIPLFLGYIRSTPTLTKIDTILSDFSIASKIQNETGASWRSWDDLIIAAQMRRIGVSEIYSNDKDYDRLPPIKRIPL